MAGQGITREQAAMVFRRAADLELPGRVGGEPAVIDSEQLEEIGSEVGLSPESVRTALAELRGGLLDEPADRPDQDGIVLTRVVPGPTGAVKVAVEELARRNLLSVRRHLGTSAIWAPTPGAVATILRRTSTSGQRPLRGLERLTSTVVELPTCPGMVSVSLRARLVHPGHRLLRLRTKAAVSTGAVCGVGTTFFAFQFAGPELLHAAVAGAGIVVTGGALRRGFRRYQEIALATEDELALFLDRLEHRTPYPHPAQLL